MSNTHEILERVVREVKCLPGWSFNLRTAPGDTFPKLVITVIGEDSSIPDKRQPFGVSHFFPAPEATFNDKSWQRWVFECCRRVMNHELGEWFRLGAERPFQPLHGPGEDPYTVHEFRPATDALTTQDGSMREPYK